MSDEDKRLDALFRSLPRERASADFTQKFLLRYADRNEPARRKRPSWTLAAATAAVAVCVTSFGWYLNQYNERVRAQAEVDAIRQEYAQLVRQHSGYQRDLAEFAVLRLGGNNDTELVLDLARFDLSATENPEGEGADPTHSLPLPFGAFSEISDASPLTQVGSGGSI